MKKFWFAQFGVARQLGRSRSGHAGIMFAVLALPLIMAVGFALDFAQANRYKAELQNVADAVALAAVRGLPVSEQQGRIDGMSLYDALIQRIRAGLLTDNIVITFQKTPDYKAIVEITATADSMFGPNINLGTITFEVNATAVLGRDATEIALVLDLSGSMTTARMKALGNSLTLFDTTINNTQAAKDKLRIAAIPFAQSVTLPTFAAEWMTSQLEKDYAYAQGRTCFALQTRTLDTSIENPYMRGAPFLIDQKYATRCMTEQAFPLTQDFAQLRAFATAFKNPPAWRKTSGSSSGTPYYGTNIFTGAVWAARYLDAGWASYLPLGSRPESANKASKFAIIMTDGEQTLVDGVSKSIANANLTSVCNEMRARNITVYTIGFSVTAASKTLLKNCAGSDANYFDASSEAELTAGFERVARTIGDSRARLVY